MSKRRGTPRPDPIVGYVVAFTVVILTILAIQAVKAIW